jgi:hypothetical protein
VRRADYRVGRVPYGLDVVLMQVVHECGVVPLGVLRPHAGLASRCCTVRDGGLEESVYVLATFGGERNMSRRGRGSPWQIEKSSSSSAP